MTEIRTPELLFAAAEWHNERVFALQDLERRSKGDSRRIKRHKAISEALIKEATGRGTVADVIKATRMKSG